MKVNVSVDNLSFMKKPTGNEIAKMKYRVAKSWKEMELEELAVLNGKQGHAIIPAHLEGGVSANNCTSMQLFVLDFDGGCIFAEIREKCDKLGLGIAYAYHTLSSSMIEERFRVVFVQEEVVRDQFIINVALQMLYKIFPECDHSCQNMDRMFFGGKELICLDERARFSLVQLCVPLLKSFDIGKHFYERMRTFANKSKVMLLEGHLAMGRLEDADAILGGNVDATVIHITGESTESPFFIAERVLHKSITCQKERKRKIEIWKGDTPCQLYNDFKSGEDIGHEARFALITNLMQINGGIKHFLEMINVTCGAGSFEKWKRDMKYLKGYHPKRCAADFCPYYGICENMGTVVDTLAMDRKVYLAPEEYVTIGEAEECLQRNLEAAFGSSRPGMHLIKAQTGLGKTSAYVRLIKENPEHRFLIALPTNRLKEEVREKLRNSGIPEESIFMTASVHGNALFPKDVQLHVSEAHSCGVHNMTRSIIKDLYNDIKKGSNKMPAVEEECEKILDGLRGIKNERVVVTTHAYLAVMEGSFLEKYSVIIDEDFLQLQAFNRMGKVSVDCLAGLSEENIPVYSNLASMMLNCPKGEYRRMDSIKGGTPLPYEMLEEMGCSWGDDNVNDLIYAGAFVRMEDRDTGEDIIKYYCPLSLPRMKYIVLSATFNYNVYQMYFHGEMEVYTYPEKKAAYMGKVQQHTYHSLGRKDLSNKKQVFTIAKEIAGDPRLDIISFKKIQGMEGMEKLNSANIHYGNSTGLNILSGKNLAIVGTPYKVDEYYKLIACYLGADVNRTEDKRPGYRRVEYKGNSFLITAYENPVLREVQLYSIESELEQCIGRARLLRNECTVYVFSAFPCEQAEIHSRNYI